MNNFYVDHKQYKLPRAAYTSKEWFDREMKDLLGETWQFAGFVDDLENYGDHICVQAGHYHIIIVRTEDNSFKAFHGICRHRGNRLLDVSGENRKVIRCPYHGWTYGLNGRLLGAPRKDMFSNFNKEDLNLKPASIAIWKTMIFVHPSDKAIAFSEWINGIEDNMGPHKPELLKEIESERLLYEVNCNWKIFAENYMDGYHLEFLHANTLNMYDHQKQSWEYVGRHWTFFEPLTDEYLKSLNHSNYLPLIDHIPREKLGAYVHLIFPNFGITETENMWSILRLIPMSPNLTLVEVRTKVMPEAAKPKWYDKKKSSLDVIRLSDYDDPLNSGDFMLEDIYVCEQIQKSMESGQFTVGPMLNELEGSITEYQRNILHFVKNSKENL